MDFILRIALQLKNSRKITFSIDTYSSIDFLKLQYIIIQLD